jgi:hypothetical protein
VFVAGDFSSMELRAVAHISSETAMTEAFAAAQDLHKLTAEAVLGVALDELGETEKKQLRTLAKAINFGLIYGSGAKDLAETAWNNYGIAMSLEHAAAYRTSFFRKYPLLWRWMRAHADGCQREGRIAIGCGRVIEAAWERHESRGKYALRYTLCCNAPVQGACADAMTRAVIGVHTQTLADARREWVELTGRAPPTVGNRPAIAAYLRDALPAEELASWPMTETGSGLSTAEAVLKKAAYLPAMRPLLQVLKAEKWLSTFGPSLLGMLNPASGRLHPQYLVSGAKSGRWSARHPNIQQIPHDLKESNRRRAYSLQRRCLPVVAALLLRGVCLDVDAHGDLCTRRAALPGALVMVVHDELVCEVPEDEAEHAAEVLQRCIVAAFAATFPGAPDGLRSCRCRTRSSGLGKGCAGADRGSTLRRPSPMSGELFRRRDRGRRWMSQRDSTACCAEFPATTPRLAGCSARRPRYRDAGGRRARTPHYGRPADVSKAARAPATRRDACR